MQRQRRKLQKGVLKVTPDGQNMIPRKPRGACSPLLTGGGGQTHGDWTRERMQFRNKKGKQPNQKMGEDLNRHFSKEDIPMIKKHMKRCSKPSINANTNYNEVSPQSSQNGHHQKNLQTNVGEGVEKREPSYTAGGNVNRYSCYGKQYGGSLKN